MAFPKVPYRVGAKSNVVVTLRGINYSDSYAEGALADSKNITAVRFPYFTTKAAREERTDLMGATSITSWNFLSYVMDNHFYYTKNGLDYIDCGEVSEDPKQYAMLYKKLVVWPDKKYLSTDDPEEGLIDMGASCSGTGAVIDHYVDSENIEYERITVSGWDVDLDDVFSVRDSINISGFSTDTNNGYHQIEQITATTMLFAADTMTAETAAGTISLSRDIPDMDFICESGNRLWGCSNSSQTIYCSRLDDPLNFYDYTGEADDSFAIDVSSAGDFTGCVKMSSSVLFFKEQCLHKILGSYNAEFQMMTYTMHGIAAGSHKSAQVINEVLYYLSTDGVYAYNGGSASLISQDLGEKRLKWGVSATDGVNYYLSCYDGDKPLFLTYFGRYGLWLKEDETRATDMCRVNNDVFLLTNSHRVYKEIGSDATLPVDFLLQFKPFYETVTGSYNRSAVAFGHKRYGKLIIRTEMSQGTWAAFDIREDDGLWREVQKLIGATGLSRVVFPIGRVDKYEIRIRGNGQFTLKNMEREFRVGSDK